MSLPDDSTTKRTSFARPFRQERAPFTWIVEPDARLIWMSPTPFRKCTVAPAGNSVVHLKASSSLPGREQPETTSANAAMIGTWYLTRSLRCTRNLRTACGESYGLRLSSTLPLTVWSRSEERRVG